ncbi:hypothetical protein C8Q80DRAFT_1119679 [Daedaleopsis nitida]|nr:hypothetical protein C8Q80DRAFT_1119679 [Daedaleopsis nitida]
MYFTALFAITLAVFQVGIVSATAVPGHELAARNLTTSKLQLCSTTHPEVCASGLTCAEAPNSVVPTLGACVDPMSAGAVCNVADNCAQGFACNEGACAVDLGTLAVPCADTCGGTILGLSCVEFNTVEALLLTIPGLPTVLAGVAATLEGVVELVCMIL